MDDPSSSTYWCQCAIHQCISHEQIDNRLLTRGIEGHELGCYCYPSFIAFDPQTDLLFVTDTGNHRIVILNSRNLTAIGELLSVNPNR